MRAFGAQLSTRDVAFAALFCPIPSNAGAKAGMPVTTAAKVATDMLLREASTHTRWTLKRTEEPLASPVAVQEVAASDDIPVQPVTAPDPLPA